MDPIDPSAELRRDEENLRDRVTGLPNAALLRDRLRMALVRRRRPRSDTLAVLCVQVDGLSALADLYGTEAAEGALAGSAARLSELLRAGDTVARIDDSEFIVICEELGNEDESLMITERVVTAFEAPMRVGQHAHQLGVAVGLVVIAGGEMGVDRVLDEARRATRRGRDDGSSRF